MMSPLEDRLRTLVAPAIGAAGFELVRLRITGAQDKTLQVMAERPDKSMSAGDCAKLSRALSPLLEDADPIDGRYTLEVSSPGIDRPLTRLSDYHDWQGYEAKLELNRLVDGRKRFRGVIGGVDGDKVCLDVEGEDDATLIPYDWIDNGKLMLSDALIKESLKAAKTTEKKEKDHDDSQQNRVHQAGDQQ